MRERATVTFVPAPGSTPDQLAAWFQRRVVGMIPHYHPELEVGDDAVELEWNLDLTPGWNHRPGDIVGLARAETGATVREQHVELADTG